MLGAQRDKYGNTRSGLKFDEFQTKFHLQHHFFSPPVRIVHVCVCVHVTLVQLASEVTLD